MPITLPPISRRRFLRGAATAAGAIAIGGTRWLEAASEKAVDPNLIAFCSDTHIAADSALIVKNISMWDHFATTSNGILSLDRKPAAVLINGDCAYSKGLPEDYATFIEAVKPLREAGLPVHLGLGNHDNRVNLLKAIPDHAARKSDAGVADHVVSVVSTPNADIYVLDSNVPTERTSGTLGTEQLAWLAAALDASPTRAALVMMHHHVDVRPIEKRTGLIDTQALLDLAKPRKQVKAILFGHTHVWEVKGDAGLHLINLPTSAYLFNVREVAGWVEASIAEKAMTLKLHAIDPAHARNGDALELAWR